MEKKLEKKINRTMKKLTAIAIILAMVVTAAFGGQAMPITSYADSTEITLSVPFGVPLDDLLAELEDLLEEIEEELEEIIEEEPEEPLVAEGEEDEITSGEGDDTISGDDGNIGADDNNATDSDGDSDKSDPADDNSDNTTDDKKESNPADDKADNSGDGSDNKENAPADSDKADGHHESDSNNSADSSNSNSNNNENTGGADNGANGSIPADDKADNKKESIPANMPFPLSGKVLKTLQSIFAMPVYGAEPEKEFLRWEFDPPYPEDGVDHEVFEYTVTPIYEINGDEIEGTPITVKVDPPVERIDSVSNLAELQSALAYINNNASKFNKATILLTALITIPAGESLTLISPEIPVTLTVGKPHRHFDVTGGELTLGKGFTITRATTGNGGGVDIRGGTFTMSDGVISGNKWDGSGGAVWNQGGVFTMNGGVISDNRATGHGGGVNINSKGTFTMGGDAVIRANSVSNSGSQGGGVYVNNSTFTMSADAVISGNQTSDDRGGGVYSHASTFTMTGGRIIGNTAPQNGGGVHAHGTFNMSGGVISGNKSTKGNGGGGVFASTCNFTMSDGTISDNSAQKWGGGVYVANDNAVFNMTGGTITGNKALGDDGGGVHADRSAEVRIGGSAVISGNTAKKGGGGVSISKDQFPGHPAPKLTMSGGTISGNSATNGGGILVGAEADIHATITGGTISGNSATNGGGIWSASKQASVLSNLKISAGVVFADNTQVGVPTDRKSRIKESSPLLPIYEANIFASAWSHGFSHGYNRHDIGAASFGGDFEQYLNITVNINDGSQNAASVFHILPGENMAAQMPAPPNRPGFLGWHTAQYGALDEAQEFDPDMTITADTTIYARWNPPEVHFYNEDELFASRAVTAGGRTLAASGQTLPDDPDPAPGQGAFLGWNMESDGSGGAFTVDTPVDDALAVHAIWESEEIGDDSKKDAKRNDRSEGNSGNGRTGIETGATNNSGLGKFIDNIINKITGGENSAANGTAIETGDATGDSSDLGDGTEPGENNSGISADADSGISSKGATGANGNGTGILGAGAGNLDGLDYIDEDGLTIISTAAAPLASAQAGLEDGNTGGSLGALAAAGMFIALGAVSLSSLLFLLWKRRREEEEEESAATAAQF